MPGLLKGWTPENRLRLYNKMQRKGIDQGGIFSATEKNIAVFEQLTRGLNHENTTTIKR